jgi:hypothetical protein
MPSPDRERLQRAIKDVVGKATRYREKKLGEQDTKASLIEPILEALGWDTRDLEQVRREYKTDVKENPVDYAMLLMNQPRLMVEAKGLGESLADRKWVGQILGYATVAGVVWCVLTDGDEYQIYNSTAPVDASEKLLCRVRLTADPLDEATEVLGLLSRGNLEDNSLEALLKAQFIDRKVRAVLEELFRLPDRRFVHFIRRNEASLTPREILDSLRRLTVKIEQPPVRFASRPGKRPSVSATVTPLIARARKTPNPGRVKGAPKKPASYPVKLTDLLAAGLLTPPVRLFRKYRGTVLEARVEEDGRVTFGGQQYDTCSTAANFARGSITGRPMSTNGWVFWQVEVGGRTRTLEAVRAKFLERKAV